MKILTAALLVLSFFCPLLPTAALAGYDEGLTAARKGDHATALREWRPLANQGNVNAQTMLGAMYEGGIGVAQDYKAAVRWYRLAADQGNAIAQLNLGMLCDSGRGVPQDYKEAAKWFRLAAAQGFPRAQYNLGVMYGNGQGVPQSRVMAYALYSMATAGESSGAHNASANRAALEKVMRAAEIEAARALVRELEKPQNFLNALDQYSKKSAVKE